MRGGITAIEEQEIAGASLELYVVAFEKDKMTLRVPTNKAEEIGANLPSVDFAALARSVGVKAHTIECWEDLSDIDDDELAGLSGPLLLDVLIDGEEIPPMKSRLTVLQDAKHEVDLSDL